MSLPSTRVLVNFLAMATRYHSTLHSDHSIKTNRGDGGVMRNFIQECTKDMIFFMHQIFCPTSQLDIKRPQN